MKDRLSRIGRACALSAMAFVFAAFAAGTVFFCGCTTGNDVIYIDETIWVYATNRIDQAIEKHSPVPDAATGDDPVKDEQGGSVGTPSDGGAPSGTGDSFSVDWRYGSFNGGKAVEDKTCQIASVSVSTKGVTFKFSGGSWGGATHDNPTMRCCAFYKNGSGKWVGGFWEWGSPDRKYRAFTNINDGYKGWNAKEFNAAKEFAFVICSKDGKKRSNVVMSKGL